MARLTNKVAVVLGASAEGGTGWAIAQALADEGAKVVVGARTLAPLRKLAAKIGGLAVTCDATRESDVVELRTRAVAEYGRLDVAVNSAGFTVTGRISDAQTASLQQAVEANYFSHVYFIKHMSAAMAKGGSIVIVSSLAATHPIFPHFAYACAKAAANCLVQYAALELGERGIRVNSLLPGPIASEMAKDFFAVPGVKEAFLREVPLVSLARPEDLADAVVWLADSAYVTGASLPVNGGLQLARFPRLDEMPQIAEERSAAKPLFERATTGAPS